LRRHLCEDDALNDGSPAYHGEVWLLPSHRVWGMRRGPFKICRVRISVGRCPSPTCPGGGGL
jgi:hypothetical protein